METNIAYCGLCQCCIHEKNYCTYKSKPCKDVFQKCSVNKSIGKELPDDTKKK